MTDENYGINIKYFANPIYNNALVGITWNGRAVYDFEEMVRCLLDNNIVYTFEDAVDFIEFLCIKESQYIGENAPIIIYPQGFIDNYKYIKCQYN